MKAAELEKKGLAVLRSKGVAAAEKFIAATKAPDTASKRVKGFLQALITGRKDGLRGAILETEELEKRYGPHISLLNARTQWLYQSGDFLAWAESAKKERERFEEIRGSLTPDRLISAHFLIGNTDKAMGHLSAALGHYEAALKLAREIRAEDDTLRLQIESAALKLYCRLGIKEALNELYQKLLTVPQDEKNLNQWFETNLNLCLSELVLFGPSIALSRRNRVYQDERLTTAHQRMLGFDFEELHLLTQGKPSLGAAELAALPEKELNPFERLFQSLLRGDDLSDRNVLQGLPPARQLVITALRYTMAAGESRHELMRQLKFLLDALSAEDKRLWTRRLLGNEGVRSIAEREGTVLLYDGVAKTLSAAGRELALRSKPQLQQLTSALAKNREWKVEDLCTLLWNPTQPESDAYFHRLRNLAYRLHEAAASGRGIERLIDISREKALICAEVSIQERRT